MNKRGKVDTFDFIIREIHLPGSGLGKLGHMSLMAGCIWVAHLQCCGKGIYCPIHAPQEFFGAFVLVNSHLNGSV